MVGTLILTHGGLARELLCAAEVIAGKLEGFEALCLDWSTGPEKGRQEIGVCLERLDQGDGVLILTDMFGGTPCNLARQFADPGRIEVLTGVNLPMVLRLGCRTGSGCDAMTVAELSDWLVKKGRRSIDKTTPAEACTPPAAAGLDGARR